MRHTVLTLIGALGITTTLAAGCACITIGCSELHILRLSPELAASLAPGDYWFVAGEEGSEINCAVAIADGVMTVLGGPCQDDPEGGGVSFSGFDASAPLVRVALHQGNDEVSVREYAPKRSTVSEGTGACAMECRRQTIELRPSGP